VDKAVCSYTRGTCVYMSTSKCLTRQILEIDKVTTDSLLSMSTSPITKRIMLYPPILFLFAGTPAMMIRDFATFEVKVLTAVVAPFLP